MSVFYYNMQNKCHDNVDFRVIKSEDSNVRDEDIKAIEKLIYEYSLTPLLYCDYIHIGAGEVDECDSRTIKIKKKIFGVGAPDVTIVIGNYEE